MDQNKEIVVLPDYLDGHDDQTKHIWRRWYQTANKIDNYPGRFQTIFSARTGANRIIDCKAGTGLAPKWAKDFGCSDEELLEVKRVALEMQQVKSDKGQLNKQWTKVVFGTKKKNEQAILDVRSQEVIDLFAKFYSVEEINKIIIDKWQMAIGTNIIRAFYVNHKDKIDRLKAEYLLSGKELRFATDMGRLEALSNLAWVMERKFEKNQSIEISKELRAIIEQIRKEIKGEEIRLTVEGRIDINATIQANQTLHEALQKLPINMIVIGLTAAKQGLNPGALMGLLASSYYSQYNGFNKLADTKEMQLPGQYIKAYNWDDIRIKNEQEVVEVEAIEVFEKQIKPMERVVVEMNKKKMIEILNSYKEQTK